MEKDPKQWIWWAIPIVVVIALGAALYYGRQQSPETTALPSKRAPASTAAPARPNYPIAPPATSQPLPELNQSDPALQESLAEAFGRSLESFLVPKDIIRHIVVTVDNLPRKKTAVQLWPLKPTAGQLVVNGEDDPLLSSDNANRYAPLIELVKTADAAQLAGIYQRYYPLFQQAYVDLGYPDGYFNNRLVEVIDHLLETPELSGDIRLTQPSVFYEFADPALEQRSAGQKLLLRMGEGNAAAVKSKLRELRREVAKQAH